MTTLFKEVNYFLSKIILDIEMGEIGLPDIQRPFVWTNTKVRDLFDSMYKGFPVGYLLFWSNGTGSGHRQIGVDTKQTVPRLLIVDGQQRLTSLYAVLKGMPVVRSDYSKSHIQIAFRPKDQKFEVADAAIRRDPEFIADISQLWSGELSRNRFVKKFLEELQKYRALSDDEEDELTETIDRLYDLQNYPFTALELSTVVDEEQVANFALVEWKDNIDIRAEPPSSYVPQYMKRLTDEGERRQMAYWHALPEGWEQMAYPEFLAERRQRMARVIRDGFYRLYE